MLGITTRKQAIALGFTHEAIFFGVRHWAKFEVDGTPVLQPRFVPFGWFAELGATLHYLSNDLSGANLDFELAIRPIAQPEAAFVDEGELA